MTEFKAFVAKIAEKSGKTRAGKPYTVYSIKLVDENGVESENWYGGMFDKPDAKEGDYIALTAEKNDNGFWNVTGIKQLKNAPAKVKPAATSGSASSGNSSTQTSIHYQSARKDAISILELLLEAKALPVSSAQAKAGEAKRYEEIMALVDKLTVRYFMDAETHRILKDVADEGEDEVAVNPDPEADDADEKDE